MILQFEKVGFSRDSWSFVSTVLLTHELPDTFWKEWAETLYSHRWSVDLLELLERRICWINGRLCYTYCGNWIISLMLGRTTLNQSDGHLREIRLRLNSLSPFSLHFTFPGILLMSITIHPSFLANSKMVFYGWIKIGIEFAGYRAVSVLEQVTPRLLLNDSSLKIASLISHLLFHGGGFPGTGGLAVFRCLFLLLWWPKETKGPTLLDCCCRHWLPS